MLAEQEVRIDPRMKRTRQLLHQALMELLNEKSFQSITVQDIAQRADVNRATFYDHFTDKYALLEYAIHEMFENQLRGNLPGESRLSLENLHTIVQTVCEFVSNMHDHCKPLDQQILMVVQTQMTAVLYDILRAWLAEAKIAQTTKPITPELAAAVMAWAIYGAALHWRGEGRKVPAGEFADQMIPILTASLHHSFRLPEHQAA